MSDYGDSDDDFDSDEEWVYMDDTFEVAVGRPQEQLPNELMLTLGRMN